MYAAKELEKLSTANFDQKIGVQIIQNALKVTHTFTSFMFMMSSMYLFWWIHNLIASYIFLQMPVHIIASNAGVEGAVIVGKLLEQENADLGYDAAKGLNSLYHHVHWH